jgi:phospholipid/cholesterol/gamma-HCH transport system permease protein
MSAPDDVTRPRRTLGASVGELRSTASASLTTAGRMIAMMLDTAVLLVESLWKRTFPWREFLDQAWFLASVSLLPTILIAIPFGMVVVLEVGGLAGQIGATSYVGAVDAIGTVRDAAPIVTALLLAGAGGSAICSDLGARTVREEIDAMEVLGINPLQRLVAPRVLASVFVAVLLNGTVAMTAIVSGYLADVFFLHGTPGGFLTTFSSFAQSSDLVVSVIKAAAFGFITAVVASYKGLHTRPGPSGVGTSVNEAVVVTGVALFLVNLLITQIYLTIAPPRIV